MRKFILPIVFIFSGCGDNAEPADVSPPATEHSVFKVDTDNATVNHLLPSIRAKLPGLDKYASQFQKISVEQNYWLTIEFHVPNDAQIPVDYMAFGHNCFIEINKEGTAVKLPKTACKALMLDKNAEDIDSEEWFDISISNTTPSVT